MSVLAVLVRTSLVVVAYLAVSGGLTLAGEHDAATDPEFSAFWDRFSEAVALDDRDAVRHLTRLPILVEGEPYEDAAFLERYDWLFTSSEKACFLNETPMPDGDRYTLFCGGEIFVFSNGDGGYRLTDIGVTD